MFDIDKALLCLNSAGSHVPRSVEKVIVELASSIEHWFESAWQKTPAVITTSVDLRHASFKLAPVDTNLFPAGFNNLHPMSLSLSISAARTILSRINPSCQKIILIAESHTRNYFYLESLSKFKDIFIHAGYDVRVASMDPQLSASQAFDLQNGCQLIVEPLMRVANRVGLQGFDPSILILNNDLSSGIPDVLRDLDQPIIPSIHLGWSNRLKSNHFKYYDEVARDFSQLIGIDPWLIAPLFSAQDGINFMIQQGVEQLAHYADKLLAVIRAKYRFYGIEAKPYLAIKADNGTYGMSVMMIHDAAELLTLNRKQRTRMAASKGGQRVSKVILQEGVHSVDSMANGAVAEPVIYMIGEQVVGGFYRVHEQRGNDENLNAPGMRFEPFPGNLQFNQPGDHLNDQDHRNQFYVYGVIARLAALAAAREAAEVKHL
ncbi:MAG: glutamate--cysteine ligase [Legionella sp.]